MTCLLNFRFFRQINFFMTNLEPAEDYNDCVLMTTTRMNLMTQFIFKIDKSGDNILKTFAMFNSLIIDWRGIL